MILPSILLLVKKESKRPKPGEPQQLRNRTGADKTASEDILGTWVNAASALNLSSCRETAGATTYQNFCLLNGFPHP